MKLTYPIPVIDVFAGPGGLSEGFASLRSPAGRPVFDVALSIEKDRFAHATLELRAFFRHLSEVAEATDYYRYVRGPDDEHSIDRETLFALHPESAEAARTKTWHEELSPHNRRVVSTRIHHALANYPRGTPWVLLGGPPCQAYSVAGRSRMRPVRGDHFEQDARHTLYKEYLTILEDHKPHIFVMENVKGLLSSELKSRRIFERMSADLRDAAGPDSYALFPCVRARCRDRSAGLFPDNGRDRKPTDFLVLCERHGIPQTRHRVIILGVRSDLLRHVPHFDPSTLKERADFIPVARVLSGLPRLRSGLADSEDTAQGWAESLKDAAVKSWLKGMRLAPDLPVAAKIQTVIAFLPRFTRGGGFVPSDSVSTDYAPAWYLDKRLRGVCNHETRLHMASDLHRYLFASCFGAVHGRSPTLRDFPRALLPKHYNVSKALAMGHGMFNDRFRVQVRDQPATTITCHLAKDGHYNIHYDPLQCRSLTVREAARIQTFPDNYFFEGPRTQQYIQVGNAVPPLLAKQLAVLVVNALHSLFG